MKTVVFKDFCYLKCNPNFLIAIAMVLLLLTSAQSQQLTFSDAILLAGQARQPKSVFTSDLDGDGDLDILSASYDDDKIAWYENTDGVGNFGTQQIITTNADKAFSVFCKDLDGDGDIDVLSGSEYKVAWYENLDGFGDFGPQQDITNLSGANSVFSIDLDGDGDNDVLSASGDKVAWYENLDGLGNFGSQQVITTLVDGANSVFSTDIDGDGDNDVLATSSLDDKVSWYENINGQGTFGSQNIISNNADGAKSVYGIDLDGDEDIDVLSASSSDDKIAWYENTDGAGNYGPQQIITTNSDMAKSVHSKDLDGDGDNDVLSVSFYDSKISWYENLDGQGNFSTELIITNDAKVPEFVYSDDLDGDGDFDVISASQDDKIAWYENIDGTGVFGPQQALTYEHSSCIPADLDGDGDLDWISTEEDGSGENSIEWKENKAGFISFSSPQLVIADLQNLGSIRIGDLDGDGDNDIVSGSFGDNNISWYENLNGQGNFGPQQGFETLGEWAHGACIADMEGDGDNDIFGTSPYTDELIWYENIDGQGDFLAYQIVLEDYEGGSLSDIDGDGDIDVVSKSNYDPVWFENLDGQGNYGPSQSIPCSSDITGISCMDCDNDGDLDILTYYYFGWDATTTITWIENMDGLGDFGNQQSVVNLGEQVSGQICDLDGDGDLDVVEGSPLDGTLSWYENTNGLGNLGSSQIILTDIELSRIRKCIDLDQDGYNDVIAESSTGSVIGWYRNNGIITSTNPQNQDKSVLKHIINYPNPFSTGTTIEFELSQPEDIHLIILNIYGQTVYEILNKSLPLGLHKIQLDGSKLPSGVLLVQLKLGVEMQYHKIVVK